ncbi:MAG: ABC transporter substrate-binding protein [Verrucomicrobia bacterium]|nr:ABC transporter substrate-binding protein [Verrucomicrobiota bacterium]MBV9299107.1 ABC transporter substrate-binding protein [Verrucomicrobiota bacterium]
MRWKALICCALLLAGFAADADADEAVKIGEVNPMTGAIGRYGMTCHQGIQLAIDQANSSGGVLGKKIDLLTEDNQSQPGQTSTIVRKFVAQDKVIAIIGDLTSSATLEGGPIAQAAKIPMVTPLATNPKVTEIGDYIFRICFIDEFQGRVMARFALENLKSKKAGILTDTKQDYSVGLSGFFKGAFVNGSGEVVREQSYSSGDTDFRAQLTSIKAAGPDVVFLPGYYPEVGIILKEARQLGITVPFLGCEAWDSPTLIQVAGKAADGCYFSNQFSADDPNPAVREFTKVYRDRFGSLPDNFAALGYDAANVVLDAINRAKSTDSIALRDAIARTKDFPGVSGHITIDAQRNASKPAVILAIKDQQVHYLEKINPN